MKHINLNYMYVYQAIKQRHLNNKKKEKIYFISEKNVKVDMSFVITQD